MKITKRGWIEIGACSLAFAVIATIAGFFDLQINHALYYPESLFGQFLANLGEFPSYLAAPLVGVILFYNDIGKTKAQKIICKIITAGVVFGGWLFAIKFWLFGSFMKEILYEWVYAIVFTSLATLVTLWAGGKIDKEIMKKLLIFAVFAAVFIALSNVCIQILKMVWQRQRYRTMAEDTSMYAGTFMGFTPWYQPCSIFRPEFRTEAYIKAFSDSESAFKSFPSGHTVAAAASFMVIILPDIFIKLKKYNWMFWVFPAIHTALVGLSRIVVGAHYLSDVLFGGFIGFGMAALVRWILVHYIRKAKLYTE